jgi:hypothetical protein
MNRPKGQKTDPWSKIYLACIFFMNISAIQRLTRWMSYEIDNLGYHRELSNFETELFFLCQSHIKHFCLHCISEPRASVTPLNSCANTPVDTSKTFAYTLISRPMYIAHSTFLRSGITNLHSIYTRPHKCLLSFFFAECAVVACHCVNGVKG